jgi:hypothetical protein
MKIGPVRAQMFHADRRTGMTMLIIAIRNFAKAPENESRKSGRKWPILVSIADSMQQIPHWKADSVLCRQKIPHVNSKVYSSVHANFSQATRVQSTASHDSA